MEDCIFKNKSQEERKDSLEQGGSRWKIGKKNFVFTVSSESRKHVYLLSISHTCAVETIKECIIQVLPSDMTLENISSPVLLLFL